MGLIDKKEKIPPMRSKEELNALKEEVETLNKKLNELTEEEFKLEQEIVLKELEPIIFHKGG